MIKLGVKFSTDCSKWKMAVQAAVFVVSNVVFNIFIQKVKIVVKWHPQGFEFRIIILKTG